MCVYSGVCVYIRCSADEMSSEKKIYELYIGLKSLVLC